MCKISIVVPVFNAEGYIRECLDSLIQQTYWNIEIILIDDGSTDNSGKICDEYMKKDSRINVFHIKNSGPSAARNYGLKKITGDYLMFVDADDWIEQDTVKICYETITKENGDVLLFNLCKVNNDFRKDCRTLGRGNKRFRGTEIQYLEEVLVIPEKRIANSNISIIGSVCKLYKKSILQECFFPEHVDYGEDCCFIAQILKKAGIVVYIDNVFYNCRILSESLSHKRGIDFPDRKIRGVNWILDFYKHDKTQEFLNEFCFKNYSEIVCELYKDNISTKTKRKELIHKFLKELHYEYDFSKIDYRCKNRNLRHIRFLVKYKQFFLLTCLLKIVKFKNRKFV